MDMPLNIRPLNKRLVLRKIEKEEKKGSLILINKKDGTPDIFEIVTVSHDSEIDAKIGDKVILERYGSYTAYKDTGLFLVDEDKVIGIFEV